MLMASNLHNRDCVGLANANSIPICIAKNVLD
jgi:hypothetical protein